MTGLFLIKVFYKKKTQPEAKTGKVKKDWKQSFVMENIKQLLSLGIHSLQWIIYFLTSAIHIVRKVLWGLVLCFLLSLNCQLYKKCFLLCWMTGYFQVFQYSTHTVFFSFILVQKN